MAVLFMIAVYDLLIKTATRATFVVMIHGSSCLYASPKYNTPSWKQGNDCIIATAAGQSILGQPPGQACYVRCFLFQPFMLRTLPGDLSGRTTVQGEVAVNILLDQTGQRQLCRQ